MKKKITKPDQGSKNQLTKMILNNFESPHPEAANLPSNSRSVAPLFFAKALLFFSLCLIIFTGKMPLKATDQEIFPQKIFFEILNSETRDQHFQNKKSTKEVIKVIKIFMEKFGYKESERGFSIVKFLEKWLEDCYGGNNLSLEDRNVKISSADESLRNFFLLKIEIPMLMGLMSDKYEQNETNASLFSVFINYPDWIFDENKKEHFLRTFIKGGGMELETIDARNVRFIETVLPHYGILGVKIAQRIWSTQRNLPPEIQKCWKQLSSSNKEPENFSFEKEKICKDLKEIKGFENIDPKDIEYVAHASISNVVKIRGTKNEKTSIVKYVKKGISEASLTKEYSSLRRVKIRNKTNFMGRGDLEEMFNTTKKEINLEEERKNIENTANLCKGSFLEYMSLSPKDAIIKNNDKLKRRYLILNEAEGITLSDFLTQVENHKISEEKIIEAKEALSQQVLSMLNQFFYGSSQYVHSDPHPGNLMISNTNNIEESKEHVKVCLIDFGALCDFDKKLNYFCYENENDAQGIRSLRNILKQYEEAWETFPIFCDIKKPADKGKVEEKNKFNEYKESVKGFVTKIKQVLYPVLCGYHEFSFVIPEQHQFYYMMFKKTIFQESDIFDEWTEKICKEKINERYKNALEVRKDFEFMFADAKWREKGRGEINRGEKIFFQKIYIRATRAIDQVRSIPKIFNEALLQGRYEGKNDLSMEEHFSLKEIQEYLPEQVKIENEEKTDISLGNGGGIPPIQVNNKNNDPKHNDISLGNGKETSPTKINNKNNDRGLKERITKGGIIGVIFIFVIGGCYMFLNQINKQGKKKSPKVRSTTRLRQGDPLGRQGRAKSHPR